MYTRPPVNDNMMQSGMDSLKNMNPDDLSRMTQTIQNMDPKFMENMMKA